MASSNDHVPFSLKGLEVFLSVCQGRGMASAAKEFGLTQPSVSQRISELEKAFGVELFDRRNRPLTLTPAGAVLRQRAESLVADAATIAPMLRSVGRVKIPTLKVGIIDSLSRAVSSALYNFLNEKSEHASIYSGHTSSHVDALLVRKLDVFIGSSQVEEIDRLERWPVIEEPFILVLPRKMQRPKEVNDLALLAQKLPLLRFSSRSKIGIDIETQLRRLKIQIPSRVEFDTSETIAAALSRGGSWAITTPLCAFQGQLSNWDFQYCSFPGTKFVRKLTLIARANELGDTPKEMAQLSRKAIAKQLAPFVSQNMPWLKMDLN